MRNWTYFEAITVIIGLVGLFLAALGIVVAIMLAKPTAAAPATLVPPTVERYWVVKNPPAIR